MTANAPLASGTLICWIMLIFGMVGNWTHASMAHIEVGMSRWCAQIATMSSRWALTTDSRSILTIIIVMALWITASTMDYNDAALAEAEYCRHVSEGLWPDYKGIFEEVCDAD